MRGRASLAHSGLRHAQGGTRSRQGVSCAAVAGAGLLIEACAGWIKKRKKGDDMRDHASVYVEVKGERGIRIWRVRNEESVGFHHVVSYFVLYNN